MRRALQKTHVSLQGIIKTHRAVLVESNSRRKITNDTFFLFMCGVQVTASFSITIQNKKSSFRPYGMKRHLSNLVAETVSRSEATSQNLRL